MLNRLRNLERSTRTGKSRPPAERRSGHGIGQSLSTARQPPSLRPHVVFACSWDDGGPILVRAPSTHARAAALSSARGRGAGGEWRSVGTSSEADYAEPLEQYEAEPVSDVAPTEVEHLEDGGSAEDAPDDVEEARAFAAEVQKLMAQATGQAAPMAQPRERPAPRKPAAPPPELPAEHPHTVFDRMNMSLANTFDAGTLDLDGIERAAAPKKPKPRIESFSAADAVDQLDLAEDLALLRAQSAPDGALHYELAPGVQLKSEVATRLAPIADAYFQATKRNIYVTSGTRSAASQARAMYKKLQGGDDLSVYKNQTAVAQIKKAYADAAGKSEVEIVEAMRDVIQKQIDGGVYISLHLLAGAVDVRKKDMSPEEQQAFKDAVKAHSNVKLVDEGTPPHFHLEFR